MASDAPPASATDDMGDALAARMLKRLRLSRNARKRARLRRIMARLKKAAPARGFVWRVHLVEAEKPNAFTTGGGHIFITTGMMDLLRDDGKIATVLSHEMAHNTLNHVVQARKKKAMARNAQAFSRKVLAEKMSMEWLGKSLSFLVSTAFNSYSRAQEEEADAEGMDILVRAGWPPREALGTFDRLSAVYRDEPQMKNFFYGNHPTYQMRRWHLQNVIRAHYRRQAGLPEVHRKNFRASMAGQEGAGPSAPASSARDLPEGLW